MRTVVVFGGRDFNRRSVVFARLDKFHEKYNFEKVVAGGATCVDTYAIEWAKSRGVKYKEEPAAWTDMSDPCLRRTGKHGEYNALAGSKRNQSMINKHKPQFAVEFPGGSGTKDMSKRVKVAMVFGIVDKHIIVKAKQKKLGD